MRTWNAAIVSAPSSTNIPAMQRKVKAISNAAAVMRLMRTTAAPAATTPRSGSASTPGPCQPPNQSVTMIEQTTVTFPYSERASIVPQRMPEYSVSQPATSSDSASGRSNGVRFVSASAAMKYTTKLNGRTRTLTSGPGCEAVIVRIDSDPTTSATVTSARICGISYEMS